MHSMLAVCPVSWLRGDFATTDATPRWKRTRLVKTEPTQPLILPVRDIRVLYGLKTRDYHHFSASQIPHAHEFFLPVNALLGPEGWLRPEMRSFIARTSPQANFWAHNIAAE